MSFVRTADNGQPTHRALGEFALRILEFIGEFCQRLATEAARVALAPTTWAYRRRSPHVRTILRANVAAIAAVLVAAVWSVIR